MILVLLILAVALNIRTESHVLAQDNQNTWSDPINVSQSGSASNPFLFTDPNNDLLAVWEDGAQNFRSSVMMSGVWGAANDFSMPFTLRQRPLEYQFLSGTNGKIYVFWIDIQGRLFYSSEELSRVDKLVSWGDGRPLGRNVDKFAVTQGEDGSIHLIYLIGEEIGDFSVGVYYTKITAEEGVLPPVAMDQSTYFRRGRDLVPGENGTDQGESFTAWSYNANGVNAIFLSWNNPITKRLFLRQSLDAGATWGETVEFVTPDESSANLVPQNPMFSQVGSSILFFWQYNQKEVMCKQYYQFSTDQGKTWSDRLEPLEDLFGCPEKNVFFSESDQNSFLASFLNSQLYLTVMKNNDLEGPQLQSEVNGFLDTSTFNNIRLQSQHVVMTNNDLYLIGAGIGDISDIWVTSRNVASLYNPESEALGWSSPNLIAQQKEAFRNIVLLSNIKDSVNAFWSQPVGERRNGSGNAIYYSGWTTPTNVVPQAVLQSAEGKSDHPSVSVDSDGRVSIVWSGGKSGDLYFSHSDINRATTSLDWVDPIQLPLSSSTVANPILKVGADSSLHIAYMIPLNEDRGVYTISSQDRGDTWSAPVRVFDAVQNCEMLEHLAFTISNSGTQHISWMCSTIPQGTGAYTLLNARSADQGKNWSVRQDSLDLDFELVWGEVAGVSQENIQLIWLEYSGEGYRLKYQRSADDGITWQPMEEIEIFEEAPNPLAITADPGGQLYLLAAVEEINQVSLSSWSWNDETWNFLDMGKLISGKSHQIDSLAAVVLLKGELGVLYSVKNLSPSTEVMGNSLFYLSRPIALKPALLQNGPIPIEPTQESTEQVLTADQNPIPVGTASVEPTLDLQALKQTPGSEMSNLVVLIVGAVLSLLVVVSAILFRQFVLNKRK